jgi:dTDP-4-dehydrorhamnose reductase
VTLLVVGASGHLGGEVCRRALAAGWSVVGTYRRTPGAVPGARWHGLDVRDGAAVRKLVAHVRPTAIVSTAYVYGDWAVSADGAAHVAAAATECGARLVHLSSDAVHGGRFQPYADDEPPTPVFPYGAAKAAAETAVRIIDPTAALVRTSLIIGDERSKQVKLCLDLLSGRMSGALFADEVRCPVAVEDLAAAVLELVGSDFAGLLNVSGPEAVSRPELGALVARRYGLDPARMPVGTIAGSGMLRPAEVRLDSSRAARMLRTRLRGVREVLHAG